MKKKDLTPPPLPQDTQFIDTHCHLDMAAYSEDLEQVFDRASANHVSRIVTIGIDLPSSLAAVKLAHQYKQVWATIGIHPHDVENMQTSDLKKLAKLHADQPGRIVGFGEIGLDYAKKYSDPTRQRINFGSQLDLAHDLQLPVVVHNRDADDDTLNILRKAKPLDFGGIMHCFSGDVAFARKVLDLNMLISIPGIATFKNATTLHDVIRSIPLSSMVLETDGPFLAPHPFRGKRNEPSYLVYTAGRIAELKNIEIQQVARETTENAEKLFKFNTI